MHQFLLQRSNVLIKFVNSTDDEKELVARDSTLQLLDNRAPKRKALSKKLEKTTNPAKVRKTKSTDFFQDAEIEKSFSEQSEMDEINSNNENSPPIQTAKKTFNKLEDMSEMFGLSDTENQLPNLEASKPRRAVIDSDSD